MRERKLGIFGKKLGMTRLFAEGGESLGVTVLEMGPCIVLGKRTKAQTSTGRTDGYCALQIGFDPRPAKALNRAELGQLKSVGGADKARRFIGEIRVSEETAAKFEVGSEVRLGDLGLKAGDLIDVTGTSKGKGFQGVMRRHHFKGFRATHGTHEYFRHGGSIGCRKWPGRVFKGRKMPGHMGARRVTTQNIVVAQVRPEENVLLVRGSVPGAKNGYVMIRPAIKSNPAA